MDRNLSLLFALNLAVSFSTQLIQPLFPLYLKSLNASEVEIGLVISLSSIAATVLMLPGGMLINRVGKKKLLLFSVFLSAVSPIFLAFINDWRMLTPFYMVFNAAFSFFVPARMALIAESATPDNRATLFGLMNIAWPLGGIISPVVSGLTIERYGWGSSFLASAAIGVASIIPTLLLREKGSKRDVAEQKEGRHTLFDRKYRRLMTLFFFFHLVETTGIGAVNLILPLLLEDRYQLSYYLIGLFFTGSNILTLITQIPSGFLADKYGRKKLTVVCISSLPIIFGLWPLVDSWILLLVLFIVANGLWSMTWPATLALLTDSVPAEFIGTAFGIRMTGVRLGFTIGPMLAGTISSSYGYQATFISAAISYVFGIPLALLFKENRAKAEKKG